MTSVVAGSTPAVAWANSAGSTFERLPHQTWPKVRAADADVEDGADVARPHRLGEGAHPAAALLDGGGDGLALGGELRAVRRPQRRVENGAVFGDVDRLTREQPGAGGFDVACAGQRDGGVEDGAVPWLLGKVQGQARRFHGQPFQPVGFGLEQIGDALAAGRLRGRFELAPRVSHSRPPSAPAPPCRR